MPVVIGITLCLDEWGRWKPGCRYVYSDLRYAEALAQVGASGLQIPLGADPAAVLERIDGLLLAGGDDFLPATPFPNSVVFEPAPDAQQGFDHQLLEGALARNLPVLGICYGMQLLALHLGGTLVYDIEHECPGGPSHRLPQASGRHALHMEPDSRLAQILGPRPGPVNSLHHQAVLQPGPELRVSARSPDGLIEAIERDEATFCIGVQWHPERLAGAHRERLFEAFIAACADRPLDPARA